MAGNTVTATSVHATGPKVRHSKMSRAKNWIFTINNYTEQEEEQLALLASQDDVIFLLYGREVGSQRDTPHLQGMLLLSHRLRLGTLKSKDGLRRAHLQVMRGTIQQSVDYCSKDGDVVVYGEQPEHGQGRRVDLESLKEDLNTGVPLAVIANEHFSNYIRYHRGIEKYVALRSTPRNWICSVVVYWGRTGTGKTRAVHDNATSLYTHVGGQWFDGYDGHKQVLFDDFSGSDFKIAYLLKLLDRYPMQVPVKGGFVNWNPEEIYITSNLDPNNWFPNAHREHVEALFRRFTFVYQFE